MNTEGLDSLVQMLNKIGSDVERIADNGTYSSGSFESINNGINQLNDTLVITNYLFIVLIVVIVINIILKFRKK